MIPKIKFKLFNRNKITEPLFLIHVMKTGGTSLRKMLINELGEKNICPNDSMLSQLPNGWYPTTEWMMKNLDTLPKHKVLLGHYPYSLLEKLNSSYKAIAFLREPYSRTISMVNHRKQKTPEFANLSFEEILDKEDFVKNQVLNYQTKVFGMTLGEVNSPYETNEVTLKIAIANLKKLEFIGLNEQYSQSCQLFDKKYKTSLSKNIRTDNERTKSEIDISDSLLNKIKPLISLDIKLYNEATKIFNTEKIKYNITD